MALRPTSADSQREYECTPLLRQYFLKSTDLSFHGTGILDNVAAELNARPRRRHGYRTPAQVLTKLLSNQSNQTGFALTARIRRLYVGRVKRTTTCPRTYRCQWWRRSARQPSPLWHGRGRADYRASFRSRTPNPPRGGNTAFPLNRCASVFRRQSSWRN